MEKEIGKTTIAGYNFRVNKRYFPTEKEFHIDVWLIEDCGNIHLGIFHNIDNIENFSSEHYNHINQNILLKIEKGILKNDSCDIAFDLSKPEFKEYFTSDKSSFFKHYGIPNIYKKKLA